MFVITGIVLFIAALYIDVQSDFKLIPTNGVKHGRGLLLRMAICLPSFAFLLLALGDGKLVIKVVTTTLMMVAWWWEFFDGWLNSKQNKSWRYNGSDDPGDATADNILQSMSPTKQAVLKWSIIIIFTTLYILIPTFLNNKL